MKPDPDATQPVEVPCLTPGERANIARATGIGAVLAFVFAAFTSDSLAIRYLAILFALAVIAAIVWQALPLW